MCNLSEFEKYTFVIQASETSNFSYNKFYKKRVSIYKFVKKSS